MCDECVVGLLCDDVGECVVVVDLELLVCGVGGNGGKVLVSYGVG